jgi:glutamate synthase (NADPH/NADH) large chain
LFAAGQAGERFAVRNSGATTVIEGCGSNGCEYMTGGFAVILGSIGTNFGAGMTGGMAFVYDAEGLFEQRVNPDTVLWQRLATPYWESLAHDLIAQHVAATNSLHAATILNDWSRLKSKFWQVVPKEMVSRLEHPLALETAEKRA